MEDREYKNKPEAFGEVVFKFKVLYHEWECDGWGFIVKDFHGIHLVMSNHGSFYVAEQNELDEFLSDYKLAISETEKAIRVLRSLE